MATTRFKGSDIERGPDNSITVRPPFMLSTLGADDAAALCAAMAAGPLASPVPTSDPRYGSADGVTSGSDLAARDAAGRAQGTPGQPGQPGQPGYIAPTDPALSPPPGTATEAVDAAKRDADRKAGQDRGGLGDKTTRPR